MNVYTGLLFLQGHIVEPALFAGDTGYAQSSYGNRVANARGLRERWELANDTDAEAGDGGEAKAA